MSGGGNASDVANTDGVAVVVLAMGTDEFLGATDFDFAIGGNDVVVATAVPAEGAMVAVDVGASELGGGCVA